MVQMRYVLGSITSRTTKVPNLNKIKGVKRVRSKKKKAEERSWKLGANERIVCSLI